MFSLRTPFAGCTERRLRRAGGHLHKAPMQLAAGGLALWLTVVSCGYQLAGRGGLPGGVQRIFVRVVENNTAETGAETLVTNALIDALNRRQPGIVTGIDAAEAVLSGSIQSLTWDTVSLKGANTAVERKVVVVLAVSLAASEGDILWKRDSLTAEQAYSVVEGDKPATARNRRNAVQAVALRLAETVYQRMTDQF